MRGGDSSPKRQVYFDSNTPNLKETCIGEWASVRGLAVMRPACHLDTQNTVF